MGVQSFDRILTRPLETKTPAGPSASRGHDLRVGRSTRGTALISEESTTNSTYSDKDRFAAKIVLLYTFQLFSLSHFPTVNPISLAFVSTRAPTSAVTRAVR
jgi:hypothetical protein